MMPGRLLFTAILAFAVPLPAQNALNFLGRTVKIIDPGTDADGFQPKGPASVCLEGAPPRQCYQAPEGIGRVPEASVVQLAKGETALLFSAASGGVSGWAVHFALLRPGSHGELDDLFPDELSVSNQGQHAFWNEPAISADPVFLTAEFVWGPNESHYSEHRYIISSYLRTHERQFDRNSYYLADQFMTAKKYNPDAKPDILGSEKNQILSRLRRVKAAGPGL
jgi:hypothetical protein